MNISNKFILVTRILVIGYVTFIGIWFSLWWLFGDATWWLVVLNYFRLELFYPAPILIILAWFSHRRGIFWLSWLPPLIFLFLFWPYFIPRPAITDSEPNLRVMTFNVLYSNEKYDAVAGMINNYQPDLIALQEVQPDMMAALVERLEAAYPYSLMGDENPYGTTAIFSRHPFIEMSVLDLTVDRPAVVTRVLIDDQPVTFVTAHLLAYGLYWHPVSQMPEIIEIRTADQNQQVKRILEEISDPTEAVIVGCDCNSREHLSSSTMLDRVLTNTAREIGWRLGVDVPEGLTPDLRLRHIDYVFYRGNLKAVGIYTVQNAVGSDHAPVIADFMLADGVE